MKAYIAGLALLGWSLSPTWSLAVAAEPTPAPRADPNFEIGGLVVDQTISRIGHLFYEELIAGWDVPDDVGTVTVRERPDAFAGNIVWVEVDDTILFRDRMGTRATGIEEKAKQTRTIIDNYARIRKENLQQLEGY